MARVDYNEKYSYEVYEGNGYDIFVNGSPVPMIAQRIPNDKPIDASKTYEENAILQIEELIKQTETNSVDSIEKLKADIEFLALMSNVELPSDLEEGEEDE